jgi:hypothetical protein
VPQARPKAASDADLRLAYDHQEGRVARHTLDGSGAVTASEHYLLDRMNPTGYEQVLEQAAGLDPTTASPTRSFVLGLSLILQADGSTLRSMLFDGHGTNRALIDATGRLASGQVLAYDAFGVRTDAHSAVLTPIQYTAQWFDEVLQGQRLTRTALVGVVRIPRPRPMPQPPMPVIPLPHKVQYTHASPVDLTDPTGRLSLIEKLVVGAMLTLSFAYLAPVLWSTKIRYAPRAAASGKGGPDVTNYLKAVERDLTRRFRELPEEGSVTSLVSS